jgi:hypothetical protein
MAYLESVLPGRLILKRLWPPRSPDLSPPDSFLWGASQGYCLFKSSTHTHTHTHTARASGWPLDPKVAGSKPGQGDGFLRAIEIRSTPSSRMGSKAGKSHVVRFYDV